MRCWCAFFRYICDSTETRMCWHYNRTVLVLWLIFGWRVSFLPSVPQHLFTCFPIVKHIYFITYDSSTCSEIIWIRLRNKNKWLTIINSLTSSNRWLFSFSLSLSLDNQTKLARYNTWKKKLQN